MASGYHAFAPGDKPPAATMNDYLSKQAVMTFASASARDTALSGILREGMVALLQDVNTITVYSGAAWSTIGPVFGALLTWTPVIVQGATPTLTVNAATYFRTGRLVWCEMLVTITSTATAANAVTISLPVAAAARYASYGMRFGTGSIVDTSAVFHYTGPLVSASTTTVKIVDTTVADGASAVLGASLFTAALASGDNVMLSCTYEAGGDA